MNQGFIIIIIFMIVILGFLDLKQSSYNHEKEMILLQKEVQRDTMPFDSIVVIQGKRYKLEKIK